MAEVGQPPAASSRPVRAGSRPCDLHLHSKLSDGILAPAQVMEQAAAAGLGVVALTDHDTMAGVPEAIERGRALGLEVLSGVEISTRHPRVGERHLLAYGVALDHGPLLERLERNRRARQDRVGRIVAALCGAGVSITAEQVFGFSSGPSVGRPHVADALVAAGHCRSRQEAFDRWLGDGKIGGVRKEDVLIEDAIAVVHEAGGVAVLAHPGRKWDASLIEELAGAGLDGVEAIHPSHGADVVTAIEKLAARLGLLATGGSDHHGDAIGLAVLGAARVPGHVAERVMAALSSRARGESRSDPAACRSGTPA